MKWNDVPDEIHVMMIDRPQLPTTQKETTGRSAGNGDVRVVGRGTVLAPACEEQVDMLKYRRKQNA